MAEEDQRLRHIFLPGHGNRENFTSPRSGGGDLHVPPRNRARHAANLTRALNRAIEAATEQRAGRDPNMVGGKDGFYLQFDVPSSQQEFLDRLENRQGREAIELVAVKASEANPEQTLSATVFVPISKSDAYQKKIDDYRENNTTSGRPRNEPLIASIDTIALATARSLFTDDPATFPNARQQAWFEVWLRAGSRAVFERAAERLGIRLRPHVLAFAEREVVLALATPESLDRLMVHTDAVAELRISKDTPRDFVEMAPDEEIEWTDELLERVTGPNADVPAVCVLDSGTTLAHPLIATALDANDQLAWTPQWTAADTSRKWAGHGTQMSGLALYGDLTDLLIGQQEVILAHRLESVKILPDHGANDPDLYGHITASAVGRIEVQAPERRRAYCLAVTADGDHWRGQPSSWSAKIDDLANGDGEDQRLFAISTGNISYYYPAAEYLDQNDVANIESPAQAWNAICVGAVTDRCNIVDGTLAGWMSMAPAGDLCPRSRTSVPSADDWPIKPDVVFEGGNQGVDPATGSGDHVDDLALLTTFNRPNERLLTVTGDTSAATAQVARMAAQIWSDHIDLWPETVRALIVHSAEWTEQMLSHLPQDPRQIHKRLLVRRYGYGVPSLSRALWSMENDVTLVVESQLRPFVREGSNVRTRDMNLHDFPWPTENLEDLAEQLVEMRVTLSYFIEPNPGERGWTQRHRYSSHGLRFAVKRAEESLDVFRRRINRAAREEDEGGVGVGVEEGWYLGPRLRDKGSIHSDVWRGTAAELANRHAIAVYPTGGWWREKPGLERTEQAARYVLVVSLRAPVGVTLHSEINVHISQEIPIPI